MTGYVYLAHPIDQAMDARVGGQVGQIAREIQARGWNTFDPSLAWGIGRGAKPNPGVWAVDYAALRRASAVVAFLPPGVPTIGVPIELDRAIGLGIPTLILGSETSWALAQYHNTAHVQIAQPGQVIEELIGRMLYDARTERTQTRDVEPLPYAEVRADEPSGSLSKSYPGDAGYDLIVSREVEVPALGGPMVDVPCNIAVELPDEMWGLIVGRSSTLRTKRLQVHLGVIDSGFRGELFAAVSSLSMYTVRVKAGERLAQLILIPKAGAVRPIRVSALTPSDRGLNGFGSTGV